MNKVEFKYSLSKRNITQKQVAEKLGVDENTVSNWVNGRTNVTLAIANKLCKAIGITDPAEKNLIFFSD
jgi:transcriptional regulator with XRE-family HTH domain